MSLSRTYTPEDDIVLAAFRRNKQIPYSDVSIQLQKQAESLLQIRENQSASSEKEREEYALYDLNNSNNPFFHKDIGKSDQEAQREAGLVLLRESASMGNTNALLQLATYELASSSNAEELIAAGNINNLLKLAIYFCEASEDKADLTYNPKILSSFIEFYSLFEKLYLEDTEALRPILLYVAVTYNALGIEYHSSTSELKIFDELDEIALREPTLFDELLKPVLNTVSWEKVKPLFTPSIGEFVAHRNALFERDVEIFDILNACKTRRSKKPLTYLEETIADIENNPLSLELLNDILESYLELNDLAVEDVSPLLFESALEKKIAEGTELSVGENIFMGLMHSKNLSLNSSPARADAYFIKAGDLGIILKYSLQLSNAENTPEFQAKANELMTLIHQYNAAHAGQTLPMFILIKNKLLQQGILQEPGYDAERDLQYTREAAALGSPQAHLDLYNTTHNRDHLLQAVRYDLSSSLWKLSVSYTKKNDFREYSLAAACFRIDRLFTSITNLIPNGYEAIYHAAMCFKPEAYRALGTTMHDIKLSFNSFVSNYPEYVGELLQLWKDPLSHLQALLEPETYKFFLEKRIAFLTKITKLKEDHMEAVASSAPDVIPDLLDVVNQYEYDRNTVKTVITNDQGELSELKQALHSLSQSSAASASEIRSFSLFPSASTSGAPTQSKEQSEADETVEEEKQNRPPIR